MWLLPQSEIDRTVTAEAARFAFENARSPVIVRVASPEVAEVLSWYARDRTGFVISTYPPPWIICGYCLSMPRRQVIDTIKIDLMEYGTLPLLHTKAAALGWSKYEMQFMYDSLHDAWQRLEKGY